MPFARPLIVSASPLTATCVPASRPAVVVAWNTADSKPDGGRRRCNRTAALPAAAASTPLWSADTGVEGTTPAPPPPPPPPPLPPPPPPPQEGSARTIKNREDENADRAVSLSMKSASPSPGEFRAAQPINGVGHFRTSHPGIAAYTRTSCRSDGAFRRGCTVHGKRSVRVRNMHTSAQVVQPRAVDVTAALARRASCEQASGSRAPACRTSERARTHRARAPSRSRRTLGTSGSACSR